MVSKADSSANPCDHPKCRFVGKTTGRIDSRLTWLNYTSSHIITGFKDQLSKG